MAIGPTIEKISFHDPEKFPKKSLYSIRICMSRPKSPNISRSPNAKALILVPKYFYIWGIDAIKIFSELVERF